METRARRDPSRSGIASVVGTMLFLLVLISAMGAQAYISGLQAQSSQAVQQALEVADQRGSEKLVFSSPIGGLSATSSGPGSANVVALVLKFSNGSAFNVKANAYIPSGAALQVQPLAGAGACGSSSCLARYNALVAGSASGSIGLVTSLGNSFWYPSTSSQISDSASMWTTSSQSTSSTSYAPVSGLAFSGLQGGRYEISVVLGYFQTASSSPGMSVGVSVPGDATLFACGSVVYPDAPTGCTSGVNAAVGTTVFPGNTIVPAQYCTSSATPCRYLATVYVAFGPTAGTFQLEFKVTGSTTATVLADSSMSVTQD